MYPNLAENINKSNQYKSSFREINNFKGNRFQNGWTYKNARAVEDPVDDVEVDEETEVNLNKDSQHETKPKPVDPS